MNTEQAAVAEQDDQKGERSIEVRVVTTSGIFPAQGTLRVRSNQVVKVVLKQAQEELDIASTEGWIVTVSGKEIDPSKSYTDNGLDGSVTLDWGPREGGGGKCESHA